MLLALWLAQGAGSDPTSAWGIVQTGGIAGILFLAVWMFVSGRIPTKQQLQDLRTQLAEAKEAEKYWRGLALRSVNLTEGHVKVTEEELLARLELLESVSTRRLAGIEAALKARGLHADG